MSHPTEHDPWLTQALRHAPDAQPKVPAALSESILQQARAAIPVRAELVEARTPSVLSLSKDRAELVEASAVHERPFDKLRANGSRETPGLGLRTGVFARLWAWLAHPVVAPTFASVMVATVVGLMWWGQPIDPSLPSAPAAPAAVVPAPAPAPAEPAEAADRSEAKPAAELAPRAEAEVPRSKRLVEKPVQAAKPVAKEERAANSDDEPVEFKKSVPARAVGAITTESAPKAPDLPARAKVATEVLTPPALPPAVAAAPAPAPLAAPAAVREDAMPAARQAARSLAKAADNKAAPESLRDEQRLVSTPVLKPGALQSLDKVDKLKQDKLFSPSTLWADIAREPQRWAWQRSGAPQPLSDAMQRGLAQLGATTEGRWHELTHPDQGDAGSMILRLLRDGKLQATLVISPDFVRLEPAGGLPLGAGLSAVESASLVRVLGVQER